MALACNKTSRHHLDFRNKYSEIYQNTPKRFWTVIHDESEENFGEFLVSVKDWNLRLQVSN